jgi:hypothetical protein
LFHFPADPDVWARDQEKQGIVLIGICARRFPALSFILPAALLLAMFPKSGFSRQTDTIIRKNTANHTP